MNNPGIDMEIWKQLRQKWTELDAGGHTIKVDFKLIADAKDDKNILAIDVVQHIDNKLLTETVQHQAGEAYAALGIAGLSMERLVEVYKGMLNKLYSGNKPSGSAMDLVVRMTWHSPTSGELEGMLVHPDAPVQNPVAVNYRHYYVLNALREKMLATTGDAWNHVRVMYHAGDVDFYFDE